jgi:23S rRNA pseudouridine1911/1915/1917 synthase
VTNQRRIAVAHRQPLLPFMLSVLGLKRSVAKRLLKFGAVHVDGVIVRQFDHVLTPGNILTLCDLPEAAAVSRFQHAHLRTVFEDDALIVVDKPAGLLTVASHQENIDTLFVRLSEYLRNRGAEGSTRVWVVHRLDRETSGLVLFAKSRPVKDMLQAGWPNVEKTYLAIVRGRPTVDQGTVANYLSEDQKSLKVSVSDRPRPNSYLAVTHFHLLESNAGKSLLEVRLETGRKHQIRVHLAGLGCPVLGDRRYGDGAGSDRLALHASQLRFTHPVTGEALHCRSAMPGLLRGLLS